MSGVSGTIVFHFCSTRPTRPTRTTRPTRPTRPTAKLSSTPKVAVKCAIQCWNANKQYLTWFNSAALLIYSYVESV